MSSGCTAALQGGFLPILALALCLVIGYAVAKAIKRKAENKG